MIEILLDVIKQIQILNANKDCDIKWLCEQAIKQATYYQNDQILNANKEG